MMDHAEKFGWTLVAFLGLGLCVFLTIDAASETANRRALCVNALRTASTARDTLTIAMLSETCRAVLRDGK